MSKRPWITTEVAVVREVYPAGGSRACAERINRTRKAIKHKAVQIGVEADRRNVQLLAKGLEDRIGNESPP